MEDYITVVQGNVFNMSEIDFFSKLVPQVDLIYTSAAFCPLLSLKLYYFAVKYSINVLCSKSIILALQEQQAINNDTISLQLHRGTNNDMCRKVAGGAVDGESESTELQKRDIYFLQTAKIVDRVECVENIITLADIMYTDGLIKMKATEIWIKLRERIENLFYDTATVVPNNEHFKVVVPIRDTFFDYFSESTNFIVSGNLIKELCGMTTQELAANNQLVQKNRINAINEIILEEFDKIRDWKIVDIFYPLTFKETIAVEVESIWCAASPQWTMNEWCNKIKITSTNCKWIRSQVKIVILAYVADRENNDTGKTSGSSTLGEDDNGQKDDEQGDDGQDDDGGQDLHKVRKLFTDEEATENPESCKRTKL